MIIVQLIYNRYKQQLNGVRSSCNLITHVCPNYL